jgi:hypothetical protein
VDQESKVAFDEIIKKIKDNISLTDSLCSYVQQDDQIEPDHPIKQEATNLLGKIQQQIDNDFDGIDRNPRNEKSKLLSNHHNVKTNNNSLQSKN